MIKLENLSKHYGKTRAVDDLSLSVERGQLYGFIGPNGAGKTTSIKMLVTLLRPDAGHMYIDGKDVLRQQEEVRRVIGALGPGGGYILSPAHAVEGDVPLENMLAFIDEALSQPGAGIRGQA